MMWALFVSLFNLLIGTVAVLSCYVIGSNLKRTIANREKLLPLHVWMISMSYLIMTFTFLYAQTDNPYIFAIRFVALLMGIYALWILVSYQKQKRST